MYDACGCDLRHIIRDIIGRIDIAGRIHCDPDGPLPVVPRMVEMPSGVILDTLSEPVSSIDIAGRIKCDIRGELPVVPRIVDVPSGVIFDTVSEPWLAV